MVAHACILSTGEAEGVDYCDLKASLGYIVKPGLKN